MAKQLVPTVDRSPADVRAVNEAVSRIKRGTNEMLLGLHDFARLKGWQVTGHANFVEWAESQDWSSSTAYRKLSQGEVLFKMMSALGLSGASTAGVAALPSIPAATASKLAGLSQETFDEAVQAELVESPGPAPIAAKVLARVEQTAIKPDRVMPPRVGAKFRQLTLSLDALTGDVVDDDREAVAELYRALGVRLSEWGML